MLNAKVDRRGRAVVVSQDRTFARELTEALKADGYATRVLLTCSPRIGSYVKSWYDCVVLDCARSETESFARISELHASGVDCCTLVLAGDLPLSEVIASLPTPSDDFLRRSHATAETVVLALRRLRVNQQLTRQVAEQAADLRRLESRKEGSVERLKFLRFASHELKAPLVAAQSCLLVLDNLLGTDIDPKVRRLLGQCINRSDQMMSMLSDLLAVSVDRSDVAAYHRDLDLVVLCREVIDQLLPEMEAKQLRIRTLVLTEPLIFNGSRYGMERVLTNLIGNAIRYTPAGGSVEVSLGVRGDLLQFRVSDSGIGIAEEDQCRVFEAFFRAGNAKKAVPYGSGLGLALVQKVVQDHGGWVELESVVEKGSTFTVWIPMSKGPDRHVD